MTGERKSQAYPLTPEAAATRLRDLKIIELRAAGMSFAKIGEVIELSGSVVAREFGRVMRELTTESASELRALEDLRLDKLLAAVWVRAMKGDDKAVAQALRISESRRRLWGLDAPAQQLVTVITEEAVDERIAALMAQLGDDLPAALTEGGPPELPGAGGGVP